MLNVLFCSRQANRSGAPRGLFHIIHRLDRDRISPSVVFPFSGPAVSDFRALCPTWVIPQSDFRFLPVRLRRRLKNDFRHLQFKRVMREVKPDVIYVNTIGESDLAIWALERSQPKILHIREAENDVMRQHETWLLHVVNHVDFYICNASGTRDFAIRCLNIKKERTATVYTSPDVEILLAAPSSNEDIRQKQD